MKRYLVTGASRGIGRAIATKIAAPEVTLLLHGRDGVALAETCRMVKAAGAQVVKLRHDLATAAGVDALIADAGSDSLDVLVNNAGVALVKPFAEVTRMEWQQTLAVNVSAPLFLMQHFAPRMKAGSSIVNILSIAAKTAFADWSVYCASKFALDGMSMAIREELRTRGIRVLNIYPAATDTEIWNGVAGDWPREQMMSTTDVANAVAYAISQPSPVAVENITLSSTAGAL